MLALLARGLRLDERSESVTRESRRRQLDRGRAWSAGCVALGVIAAAVPLASHAAVQILVDVGTQIKVQPNELINVRNDSFETGGATFTKLADSAAPPLRVTGATYRGIALNSTSGDLCITLPDFENPAIGFGGTLTISLEDDSGSVGTVNVIATQGGGGNTPLPGCHDIAPPVEGSGYPFTTQVDEDTAAGVLLPTANLLGVLRDPNVGGQVNWNPPLSVQPANAGTVAVEGTPQNPGGIRFRPAANFFTALGQF